MNTITDYFKDKQETMPKWLDDYKKGDRLNFAEILQNRIIYYAGSGLDGDVIKVFNQAHACHTYIYVDYMLEKRSVKNHINGQGLRGYKLFDIQDIDLSKLSADNVHKATIAKIVAKREEALPTFVPNKFGLIAIFKRKKQFDAEHGAERIAFIFIGDDAITTYLKLFNAKRPPFLTVLQDHAMGGNYTGFGKKGLLHQVSKDHNIFSDYAYVANNTRSWDGYERLQVSPTKHFYHYRYLFKKQA